MERAFPVRKELWLKEYDYTSPGAYFVTVCTQMRNKNILGFLPVGSVPPRVSG